MIRSSLKGHFAARFRGDCTYRPVQIYRTTSLYRYVTAIDTVFVLAVRAQREDGFKREIGV